MEPEIDHIPSLSLPPPMMPHRVYGHNYLDKQCLIQVTIGNTTYTAGQVGTISSKIAFKKAAPYLGMDLVMGGKVAFLIQLGAMFQGSPVLTYSATAGASLPPAAATQFNNEVQTEAAQVQTDLNSRSILKTWPVVGFGLQVKI